MERARKKKEGKDEKPRRVTARCWLADEFPMTVDDLLPILDVMLYEQAPEQSQPSYPHRRKDHGASFPVKVLVPIAMTVYVVMRFKDFARLPATDDGLPLPRATLTSRLGFCAQVVGPGAEGGGGGGEGPGEGEGREGTIQTYG